MKKKWIESLGHADNRFIEEADPTKPVKKKIYARPNFWVKVASCACAVALVVGAVVIYNGVFSLFDVKKYKDSPYYDVIVKLEALKKKNEQADKGNMSFGGNVNADMDMGMPEGAPTLDSNNSYADDVYEEITDNQVAGVTEGDRIKRSNRHVFYLTDTRLLVYSIEGKDSKCVARYSFGMQDNTKISYSDASELYLSEDCKTVTVVIPGYDFNIARDVVTVVQLDVSDPASIVPKAMVRVEGAHQTTRFVDGSFLIMTNYKLYPESIRYDREISFIPSIHTENGSKLIDGGNIIMPDELTDRSYTVVARFNGETLASEGSAAFLSYANDLYVGKENIYATHGFNEVEKNDNVVTTRSYTEIARLGYSKGAFLPKGSVKIEGSVKDRYSLDEYNGILRVVTTTSISQYREITVGDNTSSSNWHSNTSASLYCVDLATMQVISSKENFAPAGESVQSARFDGDDAYVCTAIVFTDPVFFFDLSDPMNITYKETDPIDGFSSSLVNFENGNLLGIGRTDWSTLKVEIYQEGEENVEPVCKFELQNVSYSTDYKSYYIDRENQIVGIPIVDHRYNNGFYLLLQFDGKELTQLLCQKLGSGSAINLSRGFYKDGCFYMFGGTDFVVEELALG